jgi:hypothetical protein
MHFDPAFAKADFCAAARLVQEQIAPDEIILIVPGHTFPVWQYYYGADGWVALPDDPILDVTHTLHYRNTADRLNQVLTGRGGVWLVEWEPWVVDPTDLVVHLLEQVGEEVVLPAEPNGLRLRYYRLQAERMPLPPQPSVSPPPDSLLDLPLALAGCAIPGHVPGDEAVRASCYWEAQGALPLHLSVSARLMDAAGVEWGRADAAISGSYLVAGRWPQRELVLGQYAVAPFPGIPPGGFYRLELLVYGPDGTRYGTAVAGPVTIDRPSQPFAGLLSTGGQARPAGRAGAGRGSMVGRWGFPGAGGDGGGCAQRHLAVSPPAAIGRGGDLAGGRRISHHHAGAYLAARPWRIDAAVGRLTGWRGSGRGGAGGRKPAVRPARGRPGAGLSAG